MKHVEVVQKSVENLVELEFGVVTRPSHFFLGLIDCILQCKHQKDPPFCHFGPPPQKKNSMLINADFTSTKLCYSNI